MKIHSEISRNIHHMLNLDRVPWQPGALVLAGGGGLVLPKLLNFVDITLALWALCQFCLRPRSKYVLPVVLLLLIYLLEVLSLD